MSGLSLQSYVVAVEKRQKLILHYVVQQFGENGKLDTSRKLFRSPESSPAIFSKSWKSACFNAEASDQQLIEQHNK